MAAAGAPSSLANKIVAPGGESGWDINYNDLENLHPIASGNFGQVLRGTYLGTEVAVKKLLDIDDEFMHKYIEREMAILKSLRHPNIVQFMGLCKHNTGLFIVTEFITRGDLRHLLKEEQTPLPWKLRLKMAVDAAQALTYLHSKNLIHRDLKSHNLLVDEHDKIKLCDFGFSRQVNGRDEPMTLCGTDEWMAPEVILGENYDTRADVFSFGCILFELISRQKPPKRAPGNKYAVDTEFVKKWTPKNCPPELLELCLLCTQWDREARPSIKDVLERLKACYAALPDDTVPAPAAATPAAATAAAPAPAAAAATPPKPAEAPPAAPARKRGRDRKATKEEKAGRSAKATKDFTATPGDDDELTFKKGDSIKVLGVDDEGWARGEVHGKTGWFPLDAAELSAENHHNDKTVKRQSSNEKLDKDAKDKGCCLM